MQKKNKNNHHYKITIIRANGYRKVLFFSYLLALFIIYNIYSKKNSLIY
jgi:hypothetical protein